jgi:8-oxo-dGTP diphosphatase
MDEPEKVLERAVLVLLRRDHEVLLSIKKFKIGKGLRNGYGGGIEEGEDARSTALRETSEECGITAHSAALMPVAEVDFHNLTAEGQAFTCRVTVYCLYDWGGEPCESPEMGPPEWFPINTPPLHEMMLADRDWLPHVLQGKRVYAEAWYGPHQKFLRQPTLVRDVSTDELDRLIAS